MGLKDSRKQSWVGMKKDVIRVKFEERSKYYQNILYRIYKNALKADIG